ncbi:hypothetical protein [Calothrix sp. 336/3]|uniref:hypothetical protein n=1 Tax=Calothrix sp. 336/3 TaxID=1337936 RepID=UPI0004E33CC2|nr:hypothetical protein [Calothrix sp. 336/3]AKG20071.1 hypothetical protein IJ00_00985 [Calothrix sp. 336/3]
MTDPNQNPAPEDNNQPSASVEEVVQERVDRAKSIARKEEVLEIYEDLLQTIWNRIMPTLGRVTVTAIMERALVLTAEKYPLIKNLEATAEGVSFEVLRQRLGEEEKPVLREALKEVITNLIDILAMLTGDILVRQLLKEIEGRRLI